MSSSAEYPSIHANVRETMAVYALILNVHELVGLSRRRNENHVREMRAARRALFQRFVIFDPPRSDVSPKSVALNIPNERILLKPLPSDPEHNGVVHDLTSVIIRVPFRKEPEDSEIPEAFLELNHSNGGHTRYLLNTMGLWQYENAAQLMNYDGTHYAVAGAVESADIEELERLSRIIGDAGIDLQTNFDHTN